MEDKHYKLDKEESKKMTGYASIDKPWLLEKKLYNVDLPNSNMSVYDYIKTINKNYLDDVIFEYDPLKEYESTPITYRQFFNKVEKCAKAYKKLGVKKGDIITVCLPSFIENVVSFYALNKIGAISNQIHPLASKDEFQFYLKEAGSKILLTYDLAYENFEDSVEMLDKIIIVSPIDEINRKVKLKVLLDKTIKEGIKSTKKLFSSKINYNSSKIIKWNNFLKLGDKKTIIDSLANGDDTAVLTHTSGTTGKSKAVETSNQAFNKMVEQISSETDILKRGDSELLVLPPYPIYVLCNHIHMCLALGIKIIFIPQVDLNDFSSYFKKHQPNHIQGIPLHVDAFLNDAGFNNLDLSYLKFLVSGGGTLSESKTKLINEFLKKHNSKIVITNGYGMTEMGSCATCTFGENVDAGIVGKPLCQNNIKIVADDGTTELKYNEIGEVWLTGPSKMKRYYKNDEATQRTLHIDKTDGTVWVKTGDIGSIDNTGNVKIIGRIKRMSLIFDSETNTVSKASHDYVESIIMKDESISNCVVIPVDNKKTNKALKAYVVVKDSNYTKVLDRIDAMCSNVFRKYVKPTEYVVVDEIPKTKAGKNDFTYIESYEKNVSNDIPKMKVLTRKKY